MVTPSDASAEAIIRTEGKTDWKHLKKAIEKLDLALNVSFHETEEGDMGGDALLKRCMVFAEFPQPVPMIFVFDRDDESALTKATDRASPYKDWGNNVFSFAIPVPSHREGHENICIEHYYSDDEIKTADSHGRRLFLSSEFNERSGSHKLDSAVKFANPARLKGTTTENRSKIVDSQVFANEVNVALPKSDFADNVFGDTEPFADFTFEEFRSIFEVINVILVAARPRKNIYAPDLIAFFSDLETADKPEYQKVADALRLATNMLEMTMHLFVLSTIRSYEDEIVDQSDEYRKKTASIRSIVADRFTAPTIGTLYELTRHCYHLIDGRAPDELALMKEGLANPFVLGPIGDVLSELERIFPPDSRQSRIVNKSEIARGLFDYVIPEFAKYANKIGQLISDARDNEMTDDTEFNIQIWRSALEILVDSTRPVLSQRFVLESIEHVDTDSRNYKVSVRTYDDEAVTSSQKIVSFDELEGFESRMSSIVMHRDGAEIAFRLFPFLVIEGDKLHYYKRTRAAGYEFNSADSRVSVEQTKRKFNQTVFGVGARGIQQSLFWTEVLPTINEVSGIRANIPAEGPVNFVGRNKERAAIKKEIIEIPNQNGIVYGVGGVGKTALMIRVSQDLFDSETSEDAPFSNVIWVSAKRNYYNPTLDIIEQKKRQFESLDNVFAAMLAFFEFEGFEGYNFEDKKAIVLELLVENTVLLVLDNFESVSRSEQEAIVKFFGIEAKHHLRRKPENLKVIITSREQIPSGFQQIPLSGLDRRDALSLMADVYAPYKTVGPGLTEKQKEKIHEVTSGIPIVIKHCFGQIYEHNRPFDSVLNALSSAGAEELVKFSFEEIFKLVRKDQHQLETILLLEIINCPLLIRQIAEILEQPESRIERVVPSLTNFQCITRTNLGLEEKYEINPQVRLFTRKLLQKYGNDVSLIKQKIVRNFTIERQMDYTTEEAGIAGIFNSYVSEGQFLEAEDFMRREMKQKPQSVLLRYQYAKYLGEQKRETDEAIELLEGVLEPSGNHPSVLKLLIDCYADLDVPNFEKANVYVRQAESTPINDDSQRLALAEHYVRWSISIKTNRPIRRDPIDEMLRQQRYKELADKAISWLDQIQEKNHHTYYLLGQCYFNKWDHSTATKMIEKAILLCDQDPSYLSSCDYLQRLILRQQEKHPDSLKVSR